MMKIKVNLDITFVNGHTHTIRGWTDDVIINEKTITHLNVPDIDGGTFDLVINMEQVLFYKRRLEQIEVDE